MAETVKIRKGDSTKAYLITSANTNTDLSNGWTVRQSLTPAGTKDTQTLNSIPYDASRGGFVVYVKPSVTEGLEVGNYIWAVEISNTSIEPQFKEERLIMNLSVSDQYVY